MIYEGVIGRRVFVGVIYRCRRGGTGWRRLWWLTGAVERAIRLFRVVHFNPTVHVD